MPKASLEVKPAFLVEQKKIQNCYRQLSSLSPEAQDRALQILNENIGRKAKKGVAVRRVTEEAAAEADAVLEQDTASSEDFDVAL